MWKACPTDAAAWWAVNLASSVTNPFVRAFVGECCAASYGRELAVYIGPDSSLQNAAKCGTLRAYDGSGAGVQCAGAGSWVFVAAIGSKEAPPKVPLANLHAQAAAPEPSPAP